MPGRCTLRQQSCSRFRRMLEFYSTIVLVIPDHPRISVITLLEAFMLAQYLNSIFTWLRRVVTQPREELDRWQQAARFAYDLGRVGARQLQHDRAPQMAAALAFRALFGLVPVLVVATVLVRAVIGVDEFLNVIGQLLAWVGLDQIRILHPAGQLEQSQTLADWLGNLISEAAGVRLTAIGWIGLAVVSYAAVSLLVTIENAFNLIYHVSDGRSWVRRVPLYWFVLTVSPLAIGLGAWLNTHFENWLTALAVWPWALSAARFLWSGFCGWAVMLTVYTLMPNADVEYKPAAVGSLVVVLILEVGVRVLGSTLQNAFAISQLYGSLGLIPLFMFWTYLMWLAVLFGLQVSAILQTLHGRRLDEMDPRHEVTGLFEPAAVVTVMQVISEAFENGQCRTPDQIADATGMGRTTVRTMLDELVAAGLLHRLERPAAAVTLARPPEHIRATELIDVGFAIVDASGIMQPPFFSRLREAQRELTADRTLASLS